MKAKFMIRSDFIRTIEGLEFIEAFGYEGLGILQAIQAVLWEQEDCRYRHDKIKLLAKLIHVEAPKLNDIITYLLGAHILTSNGETFTDSELLEDFERVRQKQETYRNNRLGKQRTIDNRTNNNCSTIDNQSFNDCQEQELEQEREQEEEPEKINSLELDTVRINLKQAGLSDPSWVDRAIQLAQSQYHVKVPTLKQLTKGWVMQELLKEKTQLLNSQAAEERLKRAREGPKPNGNGTDPDESWKRQKKHLDEFLKTQKTQ